jgi:hypothetical protein
MRRKGSGSFSQNERRDHDTIFLLWYRWRALKSNAEEMGQFREEPHPHRRGWAGHSGQGSNAEARKGGRKAAGNMPTRAEQAGLRL